MKRRRLLIILGCVVALVGAVAMVWHFRRPKVLYRVTFLPTMGGVMTDAHAINDSGRVAAAVRMADGTVRVVLWDRSDRTADIASLPKGSRVVNLAVNNAGQVAGTVFDPNHVWSSFFRDTDGRVYALGGSGSVETQIGALNDRGQVVGHWKPQGSRHAFLWDKTAGMQDLGTFGGLESLACDINDGGRIVGFFSTARNGWTAFFLDPNLGVRELGPAEFGPAATCCINNRGLVVGQFGSAEDDACISIWTAGAGPQRLSLSGDWLQVRGLDDTGRYFLNVRYAGIRLLGRERGRRSESHLWESGQHVRCINRHLGRTDVAGMDVRDVNKDGTILAELAIKNLPYPHAVLLEPIRP